MFGMEMIIAGSVTPLSTPQGRWGAFAGVTTTRAAKSRMSVRTARLLPNGIGFPSSYKRVDLDECNRNGSETETSRYLERSRASRTENLRHSAGCSSEAGIEQVSTS